MEKDLDIIDVFYFYAILITLFSRRHLLDAFIDIIQLIFAWFFSKIAYVVYIQMMKRMAEQEY